MKTLPAISGITEMVEAIQGMKNKFLSTTEKDNAVRLIEQISNAINDIANNLENGVTPTAMPSKGMLPNNQYREIEENFHRLIMAMRFGGDNAREIMMIRREMRHLRRVQILSHQYASLNEDDKSHNLSMLKSAASSFSTTANLIKS